VGDTEDDRPTGRESRLVNAAIDLLMLLDPTEGWLPPGVTLTDPALMKLTGLYEAVQLYKAHMLKPRVKRHTAIPVRVVDAPSPRAPRLRKDGG
jgi:hypothetical protein